MYNLYSRRKKDAQGNPEVFEYNHFPQSFRNQFFTIINGVLQKLGEKYWDQDFAGELCKIFAQEKGLKYIGNSPFSVNNLSALAWYIDECDDEDFLDLVDFIFGSFISNKEINGRFRIYGKDIYQEAIDELNLRLRQKGLGYEFMNGKIIEKTNTVTHKNIIKPTLRLLLDEDFRGAEEEYLRAFENYRKGENKDAILNATKAFESTMKVICSGLNYEYDTNKDTAKQLIHILEKNGFYPAYLNNHIAGIRTTLESGAPTLRNKTSGHGQGTSVQDIPDSYVEYALNLVATNILFLYKLYQDKKAGVTT